ncbi:hypothetical protein [Pseudomonas aeruginosa]|uniref:hypothetical protein n=1 Tax=Pseudomonas aeruginosa TaxID=287 RepID=UPI0015D9E969|nr:hypothetical protein [Pseudomonas aeruginosa]
MNKANECTCPSGDGSLVHPCPAHPAVEQAGGDERAAFEAWATHLPMDRQPLRPDLYMPQTQWAWEAWQFRAALAQPSPAQAEAEQPEVVAFIHERTGAVANAEMVRAMEEGSVLSGYSIGLVTLAQHDRIFGALRADRDSWAEQAEQRLADWDEMRKERDAALARVAELELKLDKSDYAYDNDRIHMRDLAARAIARAKVFDDGSDGADAESARSVVAILRELLAVGPAQAQHSVPGDIMRDAQRYRWLRDQQFYFSFSTENSDAGISSCTAGMSSRFKNLSWVDAAIDSAIAAAPGKEVGHE